MAIKSYQEQKSLVFTVRETAEILRIQRPKVYDLIKSGTIEAIKIGADWRVKRGSLERLIGPIPGDYFASQK